MPLVSVLLLVLPFILLLLEGVKSPALHIICISSLSFADPTVSANMTLEGLDPPSIPFPPSVKRLFLIVPCSGTNLKGFSGGAGIDPLRLIVWVLTPFLPLCAHTLPPISNLSRATPAVFGLSSHSRVILISQFPFTSIPLPSLVKLAVPPFTSSMMIFAFVSLPLPSFNFNASLLFVLLLPETSIGLFLGLSPVNLIGWTIVVSD